METSKYTYLVHTFYTKVYCLRFEAIYIKTDIWKFTKVLDYRQLFVFLARKKRLQLSLRLHSVVMLSICRIQILWCIQYLQCNCPGDCSKCRNWFC